MLPVGGVLQWRRDGERHIWNPDTIANAPARRSRAGHRELAAATAMRRRPRPDRGRRPVREPQDIYDEFARQANDESTRKAALRGLMTFKRAEEPIPLDEVEPATEIVKRFSTGAMSLGSLSREAHETLAIAMNRLGGKSNTGEGGEDPARFVPDANGDLRRSAIKQVASGRFGVTVDYLVNADQLQIKMAQGAKPGEGGQLPGHKVDDYIAKIRYSTPGVGPDLAAAAPRHLLDRGPQAADLRPALRQPDGVGVGQARLRGRGRHGRRRRGQGQRRPRHDLRPRRRHRAPRRSPRSSPPGVPWEIGLAETQQTLLLNDLRIRITVEVDGQMKTGRDVVDRRAARRRRVRLLDRAADRDGLHHDARLPPEHLPGRDRHPGSRAARALRGHARARRSPT